MIGRYLTACLLHWACLYMPTLEKFWAGCWFFRSHLRGCCKPAVRGKSGRASNQSWAIKKPEMVSLTWYSGTGSHGLSWERGHKAVVVAVSNSAFVFRNFLLYRHAVYNSFICLQGIAWFHARLHVRTLYSGFHTPQGDLIVPHVRLARFGQRAFAYIAPYIWNSLPIDLKNYNLSLAQHAVFKRHLKLYFLTRPAL